jgi:Domain of unknown function (DUF5753)
VKNTLIHPGSENEGRLLPRLGEYTVAHDRLAEFTEEADAVHYWALHTIPDLLQTEDYARALHTSLLPAPPRGETDKHIAVLRERQALLTAESAESGPQMTFLLDESVLRRVVGGHAVMDRQVDHLLHLVRLGLPHLTLQVAPLNTPHHPGLHRSATLIETEADRTAYLEDHDGTATAVTDPQAVSTIAQHFATIRSFALTPQQSVDLLMNLPEHF